MMIQAQRSGALDDVAARFMANRPRLHAIAHRTLGSPWLADDAVQETWIRLQSTDVASIDSLDAWLTTVVSRVCIDLIRQRTRRREDPDDALDDTESIPPLPSTPDPTDAAMRADDLGIAMQVVLDTLGPRERLALVLHDVFALAYDDIAPIVDRTPAAARQLASRARARLRGVDVAQVRLRRNAAIGAFLDAAREGDFGGLLQLLDPEIELRGDAAAVELAAQGAEHGAPLLSDRTSGRDAVARVFAGRAELTRPLLLDGVPAAAYSVSGAVHALYLVAFDGDRIARIDVLADPERLRAFQVDGA